MTVPAPEIQALLGRAAAARFRLRSLVEVLHPAHLALRAEGDAWSVRDHLAHVAAVDLITLDVLRAGPDAAVDLAPFLQQRESLRVALLDPRLHPLEELDRARHAIARHLQSAGAGLLSHNVMLPAADSWSLPVTMQLRTYVAEWALHDQHHEVSIREAVRTSISPAALALAARARR